MTRLVSLLMLRDDKGQIVLYDQQAQSPGSGLESGVHAARLGSGPVDLRRYDSWEVASTSLNIGTNFQQVSGAHTYLIPRVVLSTGHVVNEVVWDGVTHTVHLRQQPNVTVRSVPGVATESEMYRLVGQLLHGYYHLQLADTYN
jgi:hypothetical protein